MISWFPDYFLVLRWVEIKDELDYQSLHHHPVMSLDLGLAPVFRKAKLFQDCPEKICTFDIDNETFQLFPSCPSDARDDSPMHFKSLAVLKGCLCHSDTYYDDEFTVWVMKEYAVKTSWRKEMVIKKSVSHDLDWLMWESIHLVEGLKDGSILMIYFQDLLKYCPKRKTAEKIEIFLP
ncbi:hypothetical protein SSX86_006698 [Deinandra increscens subsp. villosa]|uniref:F-box associated domain-containing protein n=1 Tax=Deinandra increscens subsp. villosa TaxID=3103831 RepID=A0AAP0H6S1_9ASTR